MARHKAGSRRTILVLLTTLALSRGAAAQAQTVPVVAPADAAVVGLIAGFYLAPGVLGIDAGDPECLPCDPQTLPFFDRFVVADVRPGWSYLSTGLIFGLAAGTWADLLRSGPRGHAQVVASAEAIALANSITRLLKEAAGRNRPALYTEEAVRITDPSNQTRSWPSGHTAAAFALATSYVLSRSGLAESPSPSRVAMAVAVLVGGLRMAAGRHFTSDVIAGAAIGIGSAFVVHAIKF